MHLLYKTHSRCREIHILYVYLYILYIGYTYILDIPISYREIPISQVQNLSLEDCSHKWGRKQNLVCKTAETVPYMCILYVGYRCRSL